MPIYFSDGRFQDFLHLTRTLDVNRIQVAIASRLTVTQNSTFVTLFQYMFNCLTDMYKILSCLPRVKQKPHVYQTSLKNITHKFCSFPSFDTCRQSYSLTP